MAPGERIKCLLQVILPKQTITQLILLPSKKNQNSRKILETANAKNPLGCLRYLMRNGGLFSVYQGFTATLVRGSFFLTLVRDIFKS